MLGSIKEFKYKLVKEFLTQEELLLLKYYTDVNHRHNLTYFDHLGQSKNRDTFYYGDYVIESLMMSKIKKMEELTKLKLLPTYSYWRMYTHGADLAKHKDRPSCEVSVTVMIGSCGTKWPIFMDKDSIEMNPGDAVIYLGCELDHWREEFKGDWQAQCFLHYVDANGPNEKWKLDGRQYIGEKHVNSAG